MINFVRNLKETEDYAKIFIQSLDGNNHIVGLSGDLGSGKTTFTQAVARILGVEENVTSPTFIIEKIYNIHHPHFDHLIHIDAYRIEKGEELLVLRWKEIADNKRNLIIIEWPERIMEILPHDIYIIRFTFIDEHIRKIERHIL